MARLVAVVKPGADRLTRLLLEIWSNSGAWPEHVEAMRQVLFSGQADSPEAEGKISRWVRLPGLCCQAAGGNPETASEITLAWILFYSAAHLMDSVQDQDTPDAWQTGWSPGVVLNAASGLYFSASLALQRLYERDETKQAAVEITGDFYKTFLVMCGGQHYDLLRTTLTLDEFWQQAAAKSGSFFGLACKAGARLALQDSARIDLYGRFGHHLGMLVQILDDLEEIRDLKKTQEIGNLHLILHSLPLVYARQVLPPDSWTRLQSVIQGEYQDSASENLVLDLLDQSGAALFISTEIERHKMMALKALNSAQPNSPAGDELAGLINQL